MRQRAKLALLTCAAAMAAGAAAAHHEDAEGMTPEQHAADHRHLAQDDATGVTGIGINEAADPQVIREGGYIPPAEAARRLEEGSLSPDQLRAAETADAAPDGGAVDVASLTAAQLDDADIVNRSGMELGEVEAVLLGPDGNPAAVLVELDDDAFGAERLIEIDLAELEARPANKYLNVWSDRIELVSDRSMGWFEAAHDWGDTPRVGGVSASR